MNVNLELTDHCNLRCRMCSQSMRELAHGAEPTFMAFETWQAALQGLAGLPDVDLCPHWLGEPLLHPDFDRFAAYAFAENAGNRLFRHFKIHTNAVLLPPGRIQLLLGLTRAPDMAPDTLQAVHFSIDAFSRAAYAEVKGADKREVVYRNVERFIAERGAGARPAVHVAFVVQAGNRHEVGAFVDHWAGVFTRAGRSFDLSGEWPSMDRDAIYLRRLNSGDQATADAWHAQACARVGLAVAARPAGAF